MHSLSLSIEDTHTPTEQAGKGGTHIFKDESFVLILVRRRLIPVVVYLNKEVICRYDYP